MTNFRNRHRILIRTIAMAVVCLFTINTTSWAYPGNNKIFMTSTLSVQSMFKLMVSLVQIDGEFVISENEETLQKIQAGFQKDAEIQYFNLLKDRAKEIGLSQVGLRRFISEHLENVTFDKGGGLKKEALYQAKNNTVLLSELKDLRADLVSLISAIEITLRLYEDEQVNTPGLDELKILINPLALILDKMSGETEKIDDVVAIKNELLELARVIHQKLTYDHLIDVLEEAFEELLAKAQLFQTDDEFYHKRCVSQVFKDIVDLKNVLDSFFHEINGGEKQESGKMIDQPGLLVHGIDINRYEPPEIRKNKIRHVLSAGILPQNKIPVELKGRKDSFSLKPDVVGLSMVGNDSGYIKTGTVRHKHGVSELNKEQANITFILSPAYVSKHNKEFTGIGKGFFDSDIFRDERGEVYNRIALDEDYSFPKKSYLEEGGIYFDEVVTDSVPPEAIVGIIVSEIFAASLLEIIVKEFPERPMCILNPEGEIIFDIKGASQTLEAQPSIGENLYEDNIKKTHSQKDAIEWGQTFIDTALMRAYEAKRLYDEGKIETPDILIGAETSWIPNEQRPYIQELLNELGRLSKEKGLENLIIKRSEGTQLASILRKEAGKRGVPNSNVIILGDRSVLDEKSFDTFRKGVDPEKWAFFAGIKLPDNFPENNYIRLLEMLTNALNLWSGKPQPEDTPFMRIVQEGKRIYKFIIPEVEPMDHNLLKEIYAGQLKLMKSA